MAGEVEEGITLKAENLPTGSISFGRFELESLSWERRSSFLHNRYLEEVEKYSTPGSVTKKKEYFEAHFKKKALLHQVLEENQNEAETQHAGSIIGDDGFNMEDFIGHDNNEQVECASNHEHAATVPDEHEVVDLQKEMPTSEFFTDFSSFKNEKFAELFNESFNLDSKSKSGDIDMQLDEGGLWAIVEDKTLNDNVNSKQQAENGDALLKISKTKKNNEFIQLKTQNVSMKSTVEPKIERLQSKVHLPAQQMSKKPSSNSNSFTYGTLKKMDKQNMSAEVGKGITSKVPSTKVGNLKIKDSRNMKAKATSENKSEEGVRAKKVQVNSHPIDRRKGDVGEPMNGIVDGMTWVKLVSKADDKQNSIVFNFKSSERAMKRKEYNLKLEKRLHAKVAEMNEIQAKTEVVKEAEIKQLRKNLNFKATPMPSFYHETVSRDSVVKKVSTAPARAREKSFPTPSNQDCERSYNHTISPSIPSSAEGCSSPSANRDGNAGGIDGRKHSKLANSSGEEKSKKNVSANQGNGMGRKGERKSSMRTGSRVGRGVAVHVAS